MSESQTEPMDDTPVGQAPAERQQRRRQGSLWRELPVLVVVAVGLAFLIKSLFVQAFFIPSASMEKTLVGSQCTLSTTGRCTGDRVLVNKLVYDFRDPHRGEIIVFSGKNSGFGKLHEGATTPANAFVSGLRHVQSFIGLGGNPDESDFIKRVIGIGGDTVSCPAEPNDASTCAGVVVNGKRIDESSYVYETTKDAPAMVPFTAVTVPKGRLFVMGDHRDDSEDSRPAYVNDTVPVSSVIGRAFVKVWPPSRIGGLGVPKVWQHSLAEAVSVGGVGAAPAAAAVLVVPVAGWRHRRRGSHRIAGPTRAAAGPQ